MPGLKKFVAWNTRYSHLVNNYNTLLSAMSTAIFPFG